MLFKRKRRRRGLWTGGAQPIVINRSLGSSGSIYGGESGGGLLSSIVGALFPGTSRSPFYLSNKSAGPTSYDGQPVSGDEDGGSDVGGGLATGSPVMPAILLIGSLIVLGIVFLNGKGRPSQNVGRLTDPNTMIWVMKDTGTFYCDDSVLWGKQPGEAMTQGEALQMGYQPAVPGYCATAPAKGSGGPSGAKSGSSRLQPRSRSQASLARAGSSAPY
jgi:hypothetical protein